MTMVASAVRIRERRRNEASSGETWAAPNGAFSVAVTAASGSGFVVSVSRAEDDLIFRSSF